jgi:molybdenum cofactor biosynthesis protein B
VTGRVPGEHKAHAPTRVRFGILTVSDSRAAATDRSGDEIEGIVKAAGHDITKRAIVRDEVADIRAAVESLLDASDAVVVTGGTGVATRDVTPEAIVPLFDKRLPGFVELFRSLSWADVGSAALMSRADAGIVRGRPVFLLPGSPSACRLALERLVIPETPHLVGLLLR